MQEMPTPLRYPGGKQRIWRTIADIIVINGVGRGTVSCGIQGGSVGKIADGVIPH